MPRVVLARRGLGDERTLLGDAGFGVDESRVRRAQGLNYGIKPTEGIEQRTYDLIISDLQMPNLDGRGLHDALRTRYGQSLPRVIFVTGHAEAEEYVPFLAETGDPVLTKPFSVEDLRTLVQWVLET